jgi:acyl dehydratase
VLAEDGMNAGSGRFAQDFRVGDEFELGSYSVMRDELVDFARKYDPFPFHLDEQSAKATPFGGIIASG